MEREPKTVENDRILTVVIPVQEPRPQDSDERDVVRVINVHLDACVCG